MTKEIVVWFEGTYNEHMMMCISFILIDIVLIMVELGVPYININ